MQRVREFGIRFEIGAERSDILKLVSLEMAVVIGIGLVLGLPGAWALTPVLSSMLYNVPMHDSADVRRRCGAPAHPRRHRDAGSRYASHTRQSHRGHAAERRSYATMVSVRG